MKIAIIRLSSIGDIVLTQPILYNLKKQYPNSKIYYISKQKYFPLLDCISDIHKKIPYEKLKKNKLKDLPEFDLIIDLHSKLSTFLIKLKLKANKKITYNKKHFTRFLIVKKLTDKTIDSTLDLYLSALKKIKFNFEFIFPTLKPKNSDKAKINQLFTDYRVIKKKTIIGLFPGAAHKTKQYPWQKWVNFINSVPDNWNCQFLILGSNDDKFVATKIKRKTNNTLDMTGAVDLRELVFLIDQLDGVISNDSGPMHIAAALKKPQIALYGATDTSLGFKPLNEKAIVIESNIPCQPCSLHGSNYCPKRHFYCMNSISFRIIKESFQDLLENYIWKL